MKNVHIHILHSPGNLTPFVDEVRKISEETLDKVDKKLPLENIDITIMDSGYRAIKHIGVGGYTTSENYVFLDLDPTNDNFLPHWKKELERIIPHELHHAVRMKHIGYGETLLEAMITEGLADHFSTELTAFEPQKWSTALTADQIPELLQKAEKEYFNRDYNHMHWFFSGGKDIPHWTGYSLGYYLVSQYLKNHPEEKASTLYKTSAEEFIK